MSRSTRNRAVPAGAEARRLLAGSLIHAEIARVRDDLSLIRKCSGHQNSMPRTVALAEQRLAFAHGQARLIARGDRRAILRMVEPAVYFIDGTDQWTYLLQRPTLAA